MSDTKKRKEFREALLTRYEGVILDGMARILWVMAYADYATEEHERFRNGDSEIEDEDDLPERARNGANWDDVAPETPDVLAEQVVPDLVSLYVAGNGVSRILDLFETALRADHDNEEVSWGESPMTTSEDQRAYEMEHFLEPAEAFGGDLAMMALETGSSWFDNHEAFEIDVPRFTVTYDGQDISWEGQAGGGKHAATDPPRAEVSIGLYDESGMVHDEVEVETLLPDVPKPGQQTPIRTAADKAVTLLQEQGEIDARGDGFLSKSYQRRGDYDDHSMTDEWPSTRMVQDYELKGFSDLELREIYDRVVREYEPYVVVRVTGDQSADGLDDYPITESVLVEAAQELVDRYILADAGNTVEYGLVWSDDAGRARLTDFVVRGSFVQDGDNIEEELAEDEDDE